MLLFFLKKATRGSDSDEEEDDTYTTKDYSTQRRVEHFQFLELELPANRRKPTDIRNHRWNRPCSRSCITGNAEEEVALAEARGQSPFIAPLLCGWNRQLAELDDRNPRKKLVYYIAPCGVRLRSITEVTKYLKITESVLPGDYFTFDRLVQPLRKYKILAPLYEENDYSGGNENIPISVANTYANEGPPILYYSCERYTWEGVSIPKICSGCTCEDDCSDPRRCACQKLTVDAVQCLVPDDRPPIPRRTYQTERRLLPYFKCGIKSGIFECNDQCSCRRSRCVNRVVQRPMMIPLQLFKTAEKGWGIRSLIDIPKGQFICIYAGAILSDDDAEELGRQNEGGDEYFADLDLIGAVEREKEGFESEEESGSEDSDPDPEFMPVLQRNSTVGDSRSNSSTGKNVGTKENSVIFLDGDDEGAERNCDDSLYTTGQTLRKGVGGAISPQNSMMPRAAVPQQEQESNRFSLVSYFGNEYLYVVDAKKCGNIGRYLNHSCDPNVFVQNVLVDSHDLRFPWVSFFALRTIKAGEELCWDYNYDPSTSNKSIVCKCGAKNCRKLLR